MIGVKGRYTLRRKCVCLFLAIILIFTGCQISEKAQSVIKSVEKKENKLALIDTELEKGETLVVVEEALSAYTSDASPAGGADGNYYVWQDLAVRYVKGNKPKKLFKHAYFKAYLGEDGNSKEAYAAKDALVLDSKSVRKFFEGSIDITCDVVRKISFDKFGEDIEVSDDKILIQVVGVRKAYSGDRLPFSNIWTAYQDVTIKYVAGGENWNGRLFVPFDKKKITLLLGNVQYDNKSETEIKAEMEKLLNKGFEANGYFLLDTNEVISDDEDVTINFSYFTPVALKDSTVEIKS